METTKTSPNSVNATKLVYDFMELPHVLRVRCAQECDLWEPEDMLLKTPVESIMKWFDRARKRNLLTVFSDAIQAAKREAD